MTFTEAAEAVLRKAGKPLHYKKITQFAIEQNLLSHVGKTPEVTMSTRLATLAKKDRGEAAIVRIKPGVFGLRDWGDAAVAAAEDEPESEEPIMEGEGEEPEEGAAPAEPARTSSPEEQERAQRLAAAAALFPEEEDDNVPVLAEKPAPPPPVVPQASGGAPGAGAGGGEGGERTGEGGGRRRRRRRRRGRGGDRGEVMATAPGEAAQSESFEPAEGEDVGDEFGDEFDDVAAGDGSPGEEIVAEGGVVEGTSMGGEPGAEGAPREMRRERRDDRGDERREGRRDEGREARMEETGRDAADLIVSMLTRRDDRQPVPLRALADEGIRAGRLSGDTNVLLSALSAAARVDAARREARGERPRLRVANGRVGLVDWALGPELVRSEADALAALERLRDSARRQLLRRLNELPQNAFTEMMVLLLERLGVSSLRSARRPGLPQGEVHLAGVARRANEELKVAVVIKRGGEIGRERVIELRGSLHHYGPAQSAWALSTGSVLSGAREEAAQPGTSPVNLIDGTALARLMDEHSVGVRHASVNIPFLDFDLFDALRNG
jgi:hypothetical protein